MNMFTGLGSADDDGHGTALLDTGDNHDNNNNGFGPDDPESRPLLPGAAAAAAASTSTRKGSAVIRVPDDTRHLFPAGLAADEAYVFPPAILAMRRKGVGVRKDLDAAHDRGVLFNVLQPRRGAAWSRAPRAATAPVDGARGERVCVTHRHWHPRAARFARMSGPTSDVDAACGRLLTVFLVGTVRYPAQAALLDHFTVEQVAAVRVTRQVRVIAPPVSGTHYGARLDHVTPAHALFLLFGRTRRRCWRGCSRTSSTPAARRCRRTSGWR